MKYDGQLEDPLVHSYSPIHTNPHLQAADLMTTMIETAPRVLKRYGVLAMLPTQNCL